MYLDRGQKLLLAECSRDHGTQEKRGKLTVCLFNYVSVIF